MIKNKKTTNTKNSPWTPEDEREHFQSMIEWWCSMVNFKTKNNEEYSFKSTFTEWNEFGKIGSILHSCLHDNKNKKNFEFYDRNEKEKLTTKEKEFYVKYEDSFMKGTYPNYKLFFHDTKNGIKLNLDFNAKSLPHWVAQGVTNGWLPMGGGVYRYGFIPSCEVTGTIEKDNEKSEIKGKGYFEHVWGNFLYDRPLSTIGELKKTFSTYIKLLLWWLKEHKPKIHPAIKISTDNNPFGYDWVWAVFDNGWSLFYGNILGFFMKGPGAGIVIITKDGKKYKEMGNFSLKYNSTKKSKSYDFLYPDDFEIEAKKGKETLKLRFKMKSEAREYISKFEKSRLWKGFVICEAPGEVEGYYSDGKEKVKLSGFCKIEPQRQISVFGHNSLELKFIKSKKEIGVKVDFESNFFKKKIKLETRIFPNPKIKFLFKRIKS